MNPHGAWMSWAGIGLVGAAVAVLVYTIASAEDSALHREFRAHAAKLDKQCRLLYLETTGTDIARKQAFGFGGSVVAALALSVLGLGPVALAMALVAGGSLVGPGLWLSGEIDKRKLGIDQQLDTFLVTLANALKASPSLGDALATTTNLMRPPIRQDLEFALKENRLGTPLDQALLNMSIRIDSRSFNSALTTLLIGRQTGGDLPKILESSAATLREMARLEGVVRTKTAEGKAQAYVLGGVPFFIVVILNYVDPNWLAPLTSNFIGFAIMGIAATLWIVAIFLARKILSVDI